MAGSELMFAEEGFTRITNSTVELYSKLEAAHNLVVSFRDKVHTSDWSGHAKLEFEAFLDLTEQFHKTLLEEPLKNNKEFLEEMSNKISSFLSEFSEYNNLP